MTLQLQAAASLWPAGTTGVFGNLSALQQSAGDQAENGNELAGEFAVAMQQSQAIQQQLRSAPAESEQAGTGATTSAQSGQSVSGSSQTGGSSGKTLAMDPIANPTVNRRRSFWMALWSSCWRTGWGSIKKKWTG